MTEIHRLSDSTRLSSSAEAAIRGGVITIGNFDGVHRGHASLLHQVRKLADTLAGPAVAMVLDPHPASILRPEFAPPRLTGIQRRADLMDGYGIDALVVCETNRDFLKLSAEQFFQSLVVDRLAARAMVEGPNFFFGRDRTGDADVLKRLCLESGIRLEIVRPTSADGQMISSTRIREALGNGDTESANEMLGVPYRLRGKVTSGAGRGRQIGFPTANVSDVDSVIPRSGVYGGYATTQGGKRRLAAIHVGPSPTFEEKGESKVEVHLPDFQADLYGETLLVDFHTRVRDIARFDSPEQLVQQMHVDIGTIRQRMTGADRSI